MLTEIEGVRVDLKMKDDEMCARETVLEQRTWLVDRLEEMYEIFTGREKPVSPLKFKYHHVYTTINLTYFNFQVPKGEGDTNHPYI